VTESLVDRLTFMNGCLPRVPFRDLVPAVAAAGFAGMTCWANVWRHAQRRDGLGLNDMKALLDDHGVRLTDGEVCRSWVPGAAVTSPTTPGVAAEPHEIFEVCAALGASTVVAIHDTGDRMVLDRDAAAFASLCDAAAEHGLRVALEFVPFTTVRDVAGAWTLVEAAGRPNGGLVLDVWHHVRSGCPDAALDQVPGARIFTVQLADGPPRPGSADLAAEATNPQGRGLPGSGTMPIAQLLALLAAKGVCANIGPEASLAVGTDALSPEHVAALTRAAMKATTTALRSAAEPSR
jgi:sugar phosphate isomerase/epimerase